MARLIDDFPGRARAGTGSPCARDDPTARVGRVKIRFERMEGGRTAPSRAFVLRVAGLCGLLAPVTFIAGWSFGGLAQPPSYSFVEHSISDLGAQTADRAWLYNMNRSRAAASTSSSSGTTSCVSRPEGS